MTQDTIALIASAIAAKDGHSNVDRAGFIWRSSNWMYSAPYALSLQTTVNMFSPSRTTEAYSASPPIMKPPSPVTKTVF